MSRAREICLALSARVARPYGTSPTLLILVLCFCTFLISGCGVNLRSGAGQAASSASGSVKLAGLTCSGYSLTGSVSDQCTVSLSATAGSGGFAIALASSGSALTVPATLRVPSGSSSAAFSAQAGNVSSTQFVTISAAANSVTKTCALTLYPPSAAFSLSPTSLAFGNADVGSSVKQSLTITSTGSSSLTIRSASISGTGFSVSGASFPVSVNPGSSATLQIVFTPSAVGSYAGTLTLATNASGADTTNVALSGKGQAAATKPSYQVKLSWSLPSSSSDATAGFDIYREASGGSSYQLLNQTPISSSSYTDTTVANGVTYDYYVESVDASGNQSGPSNVFTAAIP